MSSAVVALSPNEQEAQQKKLVEENLGLVHSCANRFRNRGIEYDDLFQAGCVGLVKAVKGFDSERGNMLSTYAVIVILGEIKRLFRDGGTVKVSRSLKELALKAVRAREKFSNDNGREPHISEIADILGVTIEEAAQALSASQTPLSLTIDEDDGGGQIDLPAPAYDEKLTDLISLKEVITRLDSKDRSIIVLRYFKNKTQTQVAQLLNMTQVQVSRREKKILEVLRREIT